MSVSCSTAQNPKTDQVTLYGSLVGFSSVVLMGGCVSILACSISCRHLFCGFYSTHLRLKALPNIYHVPFLAMRLLLQAVSALLSYVSPSSPSSLPSCRSYLSVSRSSPPQFIVSAGWLHLHQVPLPLHGSLRQDTSSPSTISSAHTFSPAPQAEMNIE